MISQNVHEVLMSYIVVWHVYLLAGGVRIETEGTEVQHPAGGV